MRAHSHESWSLDEVQGLGVVHLAAEVVLHALSLGEDALGLRFALQVHQLIDLCFGAEG